MSYIVSITQPTYLPWLGYFNLIAEADLFVFLDTVQFEKQSWQTRNRVRTRKGDVNWLSVPVNNQPLNTPVKDIEISQSKSNWKKKHLSTLGQSLSKANYFQEAEKLYNKILLDNEYTNLTDMNIDFIMNVSKEMNLKSKFIRCSELPVSGNKEQLLLDICNQVGGSHFYCNKGSAIYLEEARGEFEKNNIHLEYQSWEHPEYKQLGNDFISHLSCVDAIASMGIVESAKTL